MFSSLLAGSEVGPMKRWVDVWIDLPWIDLLLALAVGAVTWQLGLSIGQGADSALQAFTGLATAAAGFGMLTTSLVASVNHPDRLRAALLGVGHRLVALNVWGILVLWGAAVLFASAIAIPASSPAQVAVFASAAVAGAGATGRSTYLLFLILKALMPTPGPAPKSTGAPILLDGPDPSGYDVEPTVPSRRGSGREVEP